MILQRCADLENMAEDASEAVRRGDVLLHSQQVRTPTNRRVQFYRTISCRIQESKALVVVTNLTKTFEDSREDMCMGQALVPVRSRQIFLA